MLKKLTTKIFNKKTFKLGILIFLLILLSPIIISSLITLDTKDKIYSISDNFDSKKIAIVFGAGLKSQTQASDILRDRVLTAVELYQDGKVEKIIMSGDNRFLDYNEPDVMIELAKDYGVDEDDLQPDYAGRRTYDTCYRAKNIFGVDEAILITQKYHLTRAIYTCESIGIDSIGVSADLQKYQGMNIYKTRELFALSLSIVDIYLRKPPVVMGENITI